MKERAAKAETERPAVSKPPELRILNGSKKEVKSAPSEYTPSIHLVEPDLSTTPPVKAGLRALSHIGALRRQDVPTSHAGDDNPEDENDGDGGESQSLDMELTADDDGELRVRTAGQRPDLEKDGEEGLAERHRVPTTNELMADEETNILRHRNDYAAWEAMNRDEPGGFER